MPCVASNETSTFDCHIQFFPAVPPRAARYTPPTRHRLAVRHRGSASSAKTVPRNRPRSWRVDQLGLAVHSRYLATWFTPKS